jgi:hypothetical protein
MMECRFCESEAVYDFGAGHILCASCCDDKVLARAKIKFSFPVVATSGEEATASDVPDPPEAVADNSSSCGAPDNLPGVCADVSSGRYDPVNWEAERATSQSNPQDSISNPATSSLVVLETSAPCRDVRTAPLFSYCTPDGRLNCDAWAIGSRCSDCPANNASFSSADLDIPECLKRDLNNVAPFWRMQ